MRLFPRTMRVAAPALLVLSLAGCAATPSSHVSTAAASSAAPDTPSSAAATASPSGPTSSGPRPCTTPDLDVSVSGGDGAAGSRYYEVLLKNTSGDACSTGGYGGVSLVGGSGDARIGAPATRDTSKKPTTVVLQPGGAAQARLQETEAENYPASRCRPAPASGFRVYPPNETHSAVVASPSTACRNAKVVLLTLSPYELTS